jgi:hypothetical protein
LLASGKGLHLFHILILSAVAMLFQRHKKFLGADKR